MAGDDFTVEVAIVFDIAANVKRVGVFQAIDELAAFAAAVRIVDDGVDLADVGVDAEAEYDHLQQRNHQRKEECGRIAAHVQRFLEEDGTETAEKIKHGPPPFAPGAYRSARRRRLRGSPRAGEFRSQ